MLDRGGRPFRTLRWLRPSGGRPVNLAGIMVHHGRIGHERNRPVDLVDCLVKAADQGQILGVPLQCRGVIRILPQGNAKLLLGATEVLVGIKPYIGERGMRLSRLRCQFHRPQRRSFGFGVSVRHSNPGIERQTPCRHRPSHCKASRNPVALSGSNKQAIMDFLHSL